MSVYIEDFENLRKPNKSKKKLHEDIELKDIDFGYGSDYYIDEDDVRSIRQATESWKYYYPEITTISDECLDSIKAAVRAIERASNLIRAEIIEPANNIKREKSKQAKMSRSIVIDLTPEQASLIDCVIGQLSDGMWENSRYYEPFWMNMDVEGNKLVIDISNIYPKASMSDRFSKDREALKDPVTAKAWFAKKAQIVQNADLKDHFGTTKIFGHEKDQAHYLDRGPNQTYGQIQDAINSLK